jgi:hypothetical protein
MQLISVVSLILLEAARITTFAWSPDPSRDAGARETFLKLVDAALASRDPKRLAELADSAAWREAGRPELDGLQLTLPPAPLVRGKDLSEFSVLYQDAAERSWTLTLRRDAESNAWKAVVRGNPCPRGGTRPSSESRPRPTPSTTTWTILECWPLPM